MNDEMVLEWMLDECLRQIMSGEATLEQCLRRYPKQAGELRPMLQAAVRMRAGRRAAPAPAYKKRARSMLADYSKAHPHQATAAGPRPRYRLAAGIAVLIVILMLTATAYAQSALPGDSFYGWTLASERAWRAVAPNPIAVDLSIADRRAEELTILYRTLGNSGRAAQAFQDYYQSIQQLQNDAGPGNNGEVMQALEAHANQFSAAGIDDPQLDKILHGKPAKP